MTHFCRACLACWLQITIADTRWLAPMARKCSQALSRPKRIKKLMLLPYCKLLTTNKTHTVIVVTGGAGVGRQDHDWPESPLKQLQHNGSSSSGAPQQLRQVILLSGTPGRVTTAVRDSPRVGLRERGTV